MLVASSRLNPHNSQLDFTGVTQYFPVVNPALDTTWVRSAGCRGVGLPEQFRQIIFNDVTIKLRHNQRSLHSGAAGDFPP